MRILHRQTTAVVNVVRTEGEPITIVDGRNRKPLAVIVPLAAEEPRDDYR
jgi:hypothetical protein